MIVTLTEKENSQLKALEEKYKSLFVELEKEIDRLDTYKRDIDPDGRIQRYINSKRLPEPIYLKPEPIRYDSKGKPIYKAEDLDAYYATPEYQAYNVAMVAANDEIERLFSEWEDKHGDDWKAARKRYFELMDEYNVATKRLFKQAELRQFSELGGDPEKILSDAKIQIETLIKNRYDGYKKDQAKGKAFSAYDLRVDGDKLLLDAETILEDSYKLLELHYDFFKGDPEATAKLKDIVLTAIADSPYTGDSGELGGFVTEEPQAETERQPYRTKAKAKEAGAIVEAPKRILTPTLASYQYSMSLHQEGGAYLQPLKSMDGLEFKNGKLYFEDGREISEMELQNLTTKEGISEIDLPTLRFYYSILFNQFELSNYKLLQDNIIVSAALLTGIKAPNRDQVTEAITKLKSYHNIIGVLHGTRNGKPEKSLFPVLNFEGYDAGTNTIAFSSPYMNYVIRRIFNLAVRTDSKTKKPKLKKNGKPQLKAVYSYLINENIRKERNKAAVENVFIIVTLIEQAGDNLPRIKASTIVERNEQLAQRLEENLNGRRLLQRVFSKTWELLRDCTRLTEAYKDIQLPDPADPANIPTPSTLDKVVFQFPHNGKIKQDSLV